MLYVICYVETMLYTETLNTRRIIIIIMFSDLDWVHFDSQLVDIHLQRRKVV